VIPANFADYFVNKVFYVSIGYDWSTSFFCIPININEEKDVGN